MRGHNLLIFKLEFAKEKTIVISIIKIMYMNTAGGRSFILTFSFWRVSSPLVLGGFPYRLLQCLRQIRQTVEENKEYQYEEYKAASPASVGYGIA